MGEVDTVIVAWTTLSVLTTLFSVAMVLTRYRNLRSLHSGTGNGDRVYRIYLAEQDIRRSALRYIASLMALTVGAGLSAIQLGYLLDYRRYVEYWPWVLVGMLLIILVNEAWDRWAIWRLRQMYKERNPEKKP